MSSSSIHPDLRAWIVDAHRSGIGIPALLQEMTRQGYLLPDSRRLVAEALHLPLTAVNGSRGPERAHLCHPQGPVIQIGDQLIHVSMSAEKPTVRLLDNFLTFDECDQLIAAARLHLVRAKVVGKDGTGVLHDARTSSAMCFPDDGNDLVARIDQRIATLLEIPETYGENLQVLRYLPGQEYRAHLDWFNTENPAYAGLMAHGGQRIATIVMYLNTPKDGGGTDFPTLGVRISALRGAAVYFAYSEGDSSSLHAGLPVREGEKWIATKWLREYPFHRDNPLR